VDKGVLSPDDAWSELGPDGQAELNDLLLKRAKVSKGYFVDSAYKFIDKVSCTNRVLVVYQMCTGRVLIVYSLLMCSTSARLWMGQSCPSLDLLTKTRPFFPAFVRIPRKP
jgi:hypothetical protein